MHTKCLERNNDFKGEYQYKSPQEKAFVHSAEARIILSEGLAHGLNGSPITANPYKGVKAVMWKRGYASGCRERNEY
jgi:hypothetical protein